MLKRAELDLQRATKLVVTSHFAIIFVLLAAHLARHWLLPFLDEDLGGKASRLFDLDNENSFATLFSITMLLIAAMVAGLLTALSRASSRRLAMGWGFAASCLLFMAMDECVQLHEALAVFVQQKAQTKGLFYIGWTLPYAAFAAIVALVGLPFLISLPGDTRRRLVLGAFLFISSALVMEMLASLLLAREVGPDIGLQEALAAQERPPLWPFLVAIEEVGEMIAVALTLRAFLLHLVRHVGVARLVAEIGPTDVTEDARS